VFKSWDAPTARARSIVCFFILTSVLKLDHLICATLGLDRRPNRHFIRVLVRRHEPHFPRGGIDKFAPERELAPCSNAFQEAHENISTAFLTPVSVLALPLLRQENHE
jgi:hypothetical protein